MSNNLSPMSSFSLSDAVAQSENNEATTTTPSGSNGEEEIPFEANEVIEGYFGFSDGKTMVDDLSVEVFDNRRVYKAFDLQWGDDLGDFAEKVEEAKNPTKMEKLTLLWTLAKNTFGAKQSELNEGYGMGWDTDESPPEIYDNDEVDHVPYFDVFTDFEAFEMATLEGGEVKQLESNGLNIEDYGSMKGETGPMIPVINGERFPVIVENGDEVSKAAEMLDTIDFDGLTFCEKDGSLQGTPTLGPSESNSDKVGEEDTDSEVNLAKNPEEVGEVYVEPMVEQLEGISSERTIQTMLRSEQEGKNRSTAIDAIEDRLEEVQSSEEEVEEEVEESEETESEWSEADKELMGTLVQSGQAESLEEAKEQIRNL